MSVARSLTETTVTFLLHLRALRHLGQSFERSISDSVRCLWPCLIIYNPLQSMTLVEKAHRLPRSVSAISWILDTESWLYTARMSHRWSRFSLQHAIIIFHTWYFSCWKSCGRGGRSPVTTRKMMIPSRAFPNGSTSVRVLLQNGVVSNVHVLYEKNAPHKWSSRASKRRSLSRGCCSEG